MCGRRGDRGAAPADDVRRLSVAAMTAGLSAPPGPMPGLPWWRGPQEPAGIPSWASISVPGHLAATVLCSGPGAPHGPSGRTNHARVRKFQAWDDWSGARCRSRSPGCSTGSHDASRIRRRRLDRGTRRAGAVVGGVGEASAIEARDTRLPPAGPSPRTAGTPPGPAEDPPGPAGSLRFLTLRDRIRRA